MTSTQARSSPTRRSPAGRFRAPLITLLTALALAGCALDSREDGSDSPAVSATDTTAEMPAQAVFWNALQTLCGNAYAGQLAVGAASDSSFARSELVMHVRECSDAEIRIPFHVGDDRSRTWVITRTPEGLRLKHDHRHADGSEDAVTQYGGDTRDTGTVEWQEFAADEHTAQLIPAAVTNVWTVEVVPGQLFAYALRREGTDRRFRVEFDLTQPVPAPPAPWGFEDQPATSSPQ